MEVNINNWFKVVTLGFALLSFCSPCVALSPAAGEMSEGQIESSSWHIHASYHNATKAIKVGDLTYVLANGDLFSYDPDGTVETYDKATHLSDFGIYDIAYSKSARTLVILYDNCNVDLMTSDGSVWNMNDLKEKNLQDKTLRHLEVYGTLAYISLGNYVAEIDVARLYFRNLYEFDEAVTRVQSTDTQLCVTTTAAYYVGNLTDNLLDHNLWKQLTADEYQAQFATVKPENANDEAALAKAQEYIPNSPIRNLSYRMRFVGDRLLVAGGKVSDTRIITETATGMIYEGGKWSALDESDIIDKVTPKANYLAATDFVQDPDDPTHHFLATYSTGLYEFRNQKYTKLHTYGNSGLMSVLPNSVNNKNYVWVSALNYDSKGNLWMVNNQCDTLIKILTPDGKWKAIYNANVKSFPTVDCTYFDSRGWAWLVNRRSTNEYGASGIFVLDATDVPETTPKSTAGKYISSFINQDNTHYDPVLWYCVREDLDGNMWFGNTNGLFVSYDPQNAFNSDYYLTQVKINRNDGSGYADYLLNGVAVKCIAIDGANRKWIGSLNNGVYLISSDGQEMLQHFTTSNSPLIDNTINDIQINSTTGEVFIATDKGLCSYEDMSQPADELSSSNIKVYPNPLLPEMPTKVTITGLAVNTTVKIANAAGRLVRQGTSTSGSFTWNCRTDDDKLVPAGIYYILATDSEGKHGATSKLLIIR